jgi:hypothetical protein
MVIHMALSEFNSSFIVRARAAAAFAELAQHTDAVLDTLATTFATFLAFFARATHIATIDTFFPATLLDKR